MKTRYTVKIIDISERWAARYGDYPDHETAHNEALRIRRLRCFAHSQLITKATPVEDAGHLTEFGLSLEGTR